MYNGLRRPTPWPWGWYHGPGAGIMGLGLVSWAWGRYHGPGAGIMGLVLVSQIWWISFKAFYLFKLNRKMVKNTSLTPQSSRNTSTSSNGVSHCFGLTLGAVAATLAASERFPCPKSRLNLLTKSSSAPPKLALMDILRASSGLFNTLLTYGTIVFSSTLTVSTYTRTGTRLVCRQVGHVEK